MRRLLACGLMLGLVGVLLPIVSGADAKATETKEALQGLQEFIGQWNGSGGPDKLKLTPKDPIWKETLNWGWRFKGDDAWITLEIKDGKYYKSGEMHYLTDKKVYQLTLVDKDGTKQVFEGTLNERKDTLKMMRTDPSTKEVQELTMGTAADGIRFNYRLARKKAGTTLFVKDFAVAANKEGLSLGAKDKKTICVVSGGLGTTPVSYKGETFYVCCSGCADAFRENPEKYVKEFKAKNKK